MARCRVWIALGFCIVFAPLTCRRATGVSEDPMDREATDALVRYLRIDTSNPPGNETAGARYLQSLLQKEGIPSQLIGSNPARQSVYARLRSGTNEKALLLLHHIDVVPVAPEEWTRPAFAGLQQGGYIWGRGALDIKSLGIAELMALLELHRTKAPLRRDVILLGVADEELGGLHGCKELIEQHPELFADVGYVLNEGGYNETIVDKVAFWGIEVQEKVPLWLRLHFRGAGGHAASPPDDGGTVAHMLRALAAVSRIETPYRLTPAVDRYFKALGQTKHDARGATMLALREPLDVDRVKKTLSPGYRSLLHDTIAITHLVAGTTVNAMPSRGTADVDIRLLPDEKTDAMLENVKSAVGKDAEVEVLLAGEPVAESPTGNELYRDLVTTMQQSQPGSAVAPVVSAGTSDSRFFRARGVVAYGIAPFKVNYYDADTVHGSDERIRARFFTEGVRLTRKIVSAFCAR